MGQLLHGLSWLKAYIHIHTIHSHEWPRTVYIYRAAVFILVPGAGPVCLCSNPALPTIYLIIVEKQVHHFDDLDVAQTTNPGELRATLQCVAHGSTGNMASEGDLSGFGGGGGTFSLEDPEYEAVSPFFFSSPRVNRLEPRKLSWPG